MDLINALLDLVVPPAGLLFLAFTYPAIACFQFWSYVLRFLFPENIKGKVVLITGASSGIGEQVAYEYAKRGARLALVATWEKKLRDVGDKCRLLGASYVHPIVADVTKEEDVRTSVDETINQFGHLNHLVCNTGVTHSYFFEDAKDTVGFHQVMNLSFWGVVYPTYYALPHLKRSRGRIVVNDSVAAWFPKPRESVYNAAKAGLLQFFDTLRVEVGSKVGITIVQPGATDSDMSLGKTVTTEGRRQTLSEEVRDSHVGPIPVAYSETVAKAAVKGALRGDHYVIVPFWYSVILLYRIFVPELVTFWLRFIFTTKIDEKRYSSKALLEVPGAKRALYPESIIKSQ